MATNVNPDKVKTDSDNILGVWKANTDFKMKEVTVESFEADNKRLENLLKDIAAKETDLSTLKKRPRRPGLEVERMLHPCPQRHEGLLRTQLQPI